jgi:peptidoglycan/LPS O-acetylase OafA/YrhL
MSGLRAMLGNLASFPPRANRQNLGYRSDIDGLRAVAVLAVLGYHLEISWFSGGFVGVDVFFVISGYLIGSLILQDVKHGIFSLLGFYARRVRRIAPAFAVMVMLIMGLAYFVLLPAEYLRLAWSALSAALSISNIYFASHTGYFDAPSANQVLLHTWSLGVEEQFYLVFPLLVLLITRYKPKLLGVCLGLLWIGSFGLSSVGAFENPQSTFFLSPARAWELLLGVLLAIYPLTMVSHYAARNLMALLGLAMIGFSIIAYSVETPFPGATALVPCLGAALVIAAGQGEGDFLVGRMLSLPPVVFVGLISYSLYLWHWPVIFFERSDAEVLTNTSRVLIVLYSFALATLSWQFVEKPFRRGFKSMPDPQVVVRGLLGLGTVAAAATFIITTRGLPARFSPEARVYAAYLEQGETHFRQGSCFIVGPYKFSDFDRDKCLRREEGRQNYLLVGDSHAAQLWYGLSNLLDDVHILQATTAGCKPQFTHAKAGRVTSCSLMMDYVFKDYLATNRVDRLLVGGRWVQRDLPGLEEVLKWAQSRDIPVTLFGPMIEYDEALPRILAAAVQNSDAQAAENHQIKSNMALDSELTTMASKYGATYVSYYKLLCKSGRCLTITPDGSPLEFDTDHLTQQGSLLVVRKLIETGQLS